MVQLTPEQLLQIALAVAAATVAIVAGIFLLVLHATRRRRGSGWFWGWTFLAATFALLALAVSGLRFETLFGFAAASTAVASAVAGVLGAYSFRNRPVSSWALALLAAAAAGAFFIEWHAAVFGHCLAPELPFLASVVIQGIVLLPSARTARMSGLQTVCAVALVLTLVLSRTLLSALILAARGQQLTELYWAVEAAGGVILCFILAIGELVALLDEVRAELEDANGALNQALEGLEVAAKLDPLTGLYNRYAFYTLVGELGKMAGSIAIIDLNGLKRINDSFGHYAGDRALLNVAMRLQEVVRQSDYVYRWGGDEFVLLLLGMPPEAARERLTHMQPPAPLDLPEHAPVQLTVSWGVAPLEADVDAALHVADAQLYAQKRLFSRAAGRLSNT